MSLVIFENKEAVSRWHSNITVAKIFENRFTCNK